MPGFGGGGYGGGGGRGGGGMGRRGPPRKFESEDPEAEQFRKLFIGGLSYETDEEGVKQHFGQWGEIVDVVVMKDPNTKRSRGFGFVTFKESINVDDAQSSRPHKIDGREVETKRAMRREDSGDPDVQQTCKKLFVGGMKEGTDEQMIRDVFEQYGAIKEVNVVADKNTGKTKGYAFIEFDDYDPVDKCVLKRTFDLNGKNVDVKKAKKKEEGGGGGGGGGRGGGRGGKGGQGGFGGQGGGGYGGQGGYQQGGYGGGYGSGGYDDGYGGGYSQGAGYNQGGYEGYGGGYSGGYAGGQGGGDWSSFGQGYGGQSGGGPMRGQGYGNQGGGQPYQSGGRGGRGGRGRGGGGGGYSQ